MHLTIIVYDLQEGSLLLQALEGGYNLTSISRSVSACTNVLLGSVPAPVSELSTIADSALYLKPKFAVAIRETRRSLGLYWRALGLIDGVDEDAMLAALKRRMTAIYTLCAPDKLHKLPSIFKKYSGREHELCAAVQTKCGNMLALVLLSQGFEVLVVLD
ncbi:hypothetical protein OAN61_00930 [bacterium]|nr:hypothetical protein [bacterium]